jgi:murein DD-endopeptidase MepM/ murein hydrolase activator NlpD
MGDGPHALLLHETTQREGARETLHEGGKDCSSPPHGLFAVGEPTRPTQGRCVLLPVRATRTTCCVVIAASLADPQDGRMCAAAQAVDRRLAIVAGGRRTPVGPDRTPVPLLSIPVAPMPILVAPRRPPALPGRRSRLPRQLVPMVLALLTAVGATGAMPALANPTDSPRRAVSSSSPHAGEQIYTVPTSAAEPRLARLAEVTVVAPAPPAWVAPTKGALRDGFGPRPTAPVAGVSTFHRGQDLGASCGATVRAAAAGRVVEAGWSGSYGRWVRIRHANGVETGYAHAEQLLVRVGRQVKAGTPIALAGSTGASSGCHLHFEVRLRGTAIDAVPFMRSRSARLGR